ncbi:MAG: hypothetical protein R3A44_37845 [Caldilineaceae bacterium]
MTFQEYKTSLQNAAPPAGLNRALEALWQAGKGNWTVSHEITQAPGDPNVDWVHAWLHRQEGDLSNAGYWYRKAGQPVYEGELQDEWDAIAQALLGG